MLSIGGFFKWWIDELARVVEPLAARRGGRPAYIVVQDGDHFVCNRAGRKGLTEVGRFEADSTNGSNLLKKLKNQNVELRLDPELVLDKHLSLPAAGQQYLEPILRHQIERLTPWASDHVVFDYVVGDGASDGEGQVPIRLVATARDTVRGALQPFTERSIVLRRVGTAADPLDQMSPIDLQKAGKSEREATLRRMVAAGLAGLAAVLLIIGGFQSWRLVEATRESENVQRLIDARRALIAEAVARTTASDEYRALAALKESSLPMVILLEELSTTIPDNTYLTELNVEGDTLRINGMSREAPALISLLEEAGSLADARFAAPTTRSENGRSDSFQIVVRIEPQEVAGQ